MTTKFVHALKLTKFDAAANVAAMELQDEIERHERHFELQADNGYLPSEDQLNYVELCRRCIRAEKLLASIVKQAGLYSDARHCSECGRILVWETDGGRRVCEFGHTSKPL